MYNYFLTLSFNMSILFLDKSTLYFDDYTHIYYL